MSSARRGRGVLEPDPKLDGFRLSADDRCWWCGDRATTEEHRIKASTLRRVGRAEDGTTEPGSVFKKSSDYEGALRTIRKGAQVRWRRNLCADCNNSKSQPFDNAYDDFEAFLVEHFNEIAEWERLDWRNVYGNEWRTGAADLARYFAKQLACMLSTYDLPIPEDLVLFLDGADRCSSVCFMLVINPRVIELMHSEGAEVDMSTFVGLLRAPAYQTAGEFTGVDYGYHIGYLNFLVQWREGQDFSSWFEHQSIDLPRFSEE